MRLLNFAREFDVTLDSVNRDDPTFRIRTSRSLRPKKAKQGVGVLYFYSTPDISREGIPMTWNHGLLMEHTRPADTDIRPAKSVADFNLRFHNKFPCAGMLTEDRGFLVGPTIKLSILRRGDVALMLISPPLQEMRVSPGRTHLTIPNDGSQANIVLRANGELRCEGTLSAGDLKLAEILLTRNSNPPLGDMEIVERLAQRNEPGIIFATWKPIVRSFQDLLYVFRPGSVGREDFDRIAWNVGGSVESDGVVSRPFVIGDSGAGSYTVRLVLNRRLRRSRTDLTQVVLS